MLINCAPAALKNRVSEKSPALSVTALATATILVCTAVNFASGTGAAFASLTTPDKRAVKVCPIAIPANNFSHINQRIICAA